MLAVITANGLLGGVNHVVSSVEPFLGPILTLTQILVGVLTAVWIYNRNRGTVLENKKKEQDDEL